MRASSSNEPTVLGRYALYGEIAKGGMASVHLGRLLGSVGFTRTVAIKRLHSRYAGNRDFVEMLIDEARLAARIRHPNVVPVLDVVTHGQEVFLVMEYIQGESLARLLKASRGQEIPARIAVSVVAGALNGLHAAHEAQTERGEPLNIVHRDVSPQNILVGTDGLARVTDFGIAKAAKRLHETRSGEIKGKISYMAPEHLDGRPVDRRTNVYAASVILWEALTGRRLFAASDTMEVIRRVMQGQVPRPRELRPDIPLELEEIVLRGLHIDASGRYATAREMAIAIERVLPGAPSSEVAEWVERTAMDSLADRARVLAEMERASASTTKIELTAFDDSHDDTQRFLPGVSEAFAAVDAPGPSSLGKTVVSAGNPGQLASTAYELPGVATLTSDPPKSDDIESLKATVRDRPLANERPVADQPARIHPPPKPKKRGVYYLVAFVLTGGLATATITLARQRSSSALPESPSSVPAEPAVAAGSSETLLAPKSEVAPLVSATSPAKSPPPVESAPEPTPSAPRVTRAVPARVPPRPSKSASAAPPASPPPTGEDDFGNLLRK